ncbi:MAG: GNAT family N-acetyltransferase [Blastochloris sp.]|nr:GNAT family N-acetyltransferase [Blastochloris sp.]
MELRPVTLEDAEAYLQLTRQIEAERDVSFYQHGEAIDNVSDQRSYLEWLRSSQNRQLLVALSGSDWVGYAMALGGELRIDQHAAIVVVEVLRSMQRRGIGTALMLEIEAWAWQHRLRRLELSVLATNHAAIQLYLKLGYQQEGLRRQARFIGNELQDEWIMAKLLS